MERKAGESYGNPSRPLAKCYLCNLFLEIYSANVFLVIFNIMTFDGMMASLASEPINRQRVFGTPILESRWLHMCCGAHQSEYL
jgi:hypothetical protein